MKHIKQLLVFLLIISVFNSCEKEEEVSYAMDDISAPTNIEALFDISSEEVGMVTVTPSADGASMFEVYFGDSENETPTEVAPGETITYVYGEGEFNLRILAIGLTGLTSELVRVVTISLEAPKDLEMDIKISETNPFEIEVSASATNATVFDVYFGDTPDEDRAEDGDPVTIMPEDTATYEYSATGDYTVRVVARGAGAATAETTQEVTISGATNPVKLPITFDDATVNYALGTFDGATFEVVSNPFLSGVNTEESMVGKITNSGSLYEGGAYDLSEQPIDFSGDNKTISMKFYSDQPVSVLVKVEGGTNDDRPNEVSADHGGTGWEELTFNFATDALKSYIDGDPENFTAFVPTGKYNTLVVFVEIGETTTGTFYIDDLEFDGGNSDGGDTNGQIFDDFDANRNIGTWYGDACGMDDAFANPFKTGINTSETVLEYNDDGGQYANVGFNVDPNFDLTVDNTFSLKIYVPSSSVTGSQPNQISLKLQDGTVAEPWAQQTEIIKPIVLDEWQTVTFDFANDDTAGAADPLSRTDFNRVVLQVNGENNNDAVIAYIDDFSYGVNGGGDASGKISDDFDANRNIGTWYGDACGMDDAFANPFKTGINTSNTVLEYNDDGGQYANVGFNVDPNFDLTVDNTFSLKIYVPSSSITGSQPNQISLKLQDGTVGEPWAQQTEIIKPIELDKWQIVTFDFANDNTAGAADPLSRTDFNRVVLQVNGENNNDYVTAYIDDFIYGENAATGSTGGGTGDGDTNAGGGTPNEVADNLQVSENSDFETGTLDGWAVYENGGIVTADNTQSSNGGEWSAKIVASSPSGLNPTLKQERKGAGSVTVGDIVQVKFDYMGSAAAGGIYSMQSFVEAENGVNQTEVFSVTPTGDWQTFTTTYTVNAGDVSGGITTEFTAICGSDPACNSTLFLDNISIILNP